MISKGFLDEQEALELPSREMLNLFDLTINVPVVFQQNINVQVCGVGFGNTASCSNVQGNWGSLTFGG